MIAIMLGAVQLFALALAFAAARRANYGWAVALALPGLAGAIGNFYGNLDGPYLGKFCLLVGAEATLVITVALGACAYLKIGVSYSIELEPEPQPPTGGQWHEMPPPNAPYQPLVSRHNIDTPTQPVFDHTTMWRARHAAV